MIEIDDQIEPIAPVVEPAALDRDSALSQSLCSILSLESADVEIGALMIQRPMIDFASQMESLNRMNMVDEEEKRPVLLLTKSEKELRLINRNREALDKRDEMLA